MKRRLASLLGALAFAVPFSPAVAATVSQVGGVQVIVNGVAAPAAPAPKHKAKAKAHKQPAPQTAAPRYNAADEAAVDALPSIAYGASPAAARVIHNAWAFMGVPYVWGGTSPNGFDCSGFVQYVYQMSGYSIPRTADAQFAAGVPIAGYPEPGDLVFFQTYDYGASHVGIYIGDGWFLQEIRPNVHLTNFANSNYFRSRYLGARRFLT